MLSQQDLQKKEAAIKGAEYVKDGMIVGLGTGSTVKFLVEELARRVREEKLDITGVTTSSPTSRLAKELGVKMLGLDEVAAVDFLIDGADEVDTRLYGIKGGGGALLMEKIVATYAKDYIWIVDEGKLVDTLGKFPLPVEVVPYGAEQLFNLLEEQNFSPKWRLNEYGRRFVTDQQHFIIDCSLWRIAEPTVLAEKLDAMTGVVDHGLFIQMVNKVIVGGENGIKILEK